MFFFFYNLIVFDPRVLLLYGDITDWKVDSEIAIVPLGPIVLPEPRKKFSSNKTNNIWTKIKDCLRSQCKKNSNRIFVMNFYFLTLICSCSCYAFIERTVIKYIIQINRCLGL